MRKLLGCLAVLLGAGSVALAARYGFKGSDTLVDGSISAAVFGAIALCAFLLHGVAVRLGLEGHRLGAAVIGLIAVAALFVTFTNSLGAIAARGDSTLAERAKAVDTRKDDRAELTRLTAERAAMTFAPATAEAVSTAREAVKAAERSRKAECGDGDPKQRGSNCRGRETTEATARDTLATTIANKEATERAAALDADIRALRKRLEGGTAVANPNPLGAALEAMLGAGAAALTAWQQAIVAAVYELCLVAVMVAFELLRHGKEQAGAPAAAAPADLAREPPPVPEATVIPPIRAALLPPRGARAKPAITSASTVKAYLREHLFPADSDGHRLDIKAMVQGYRDWCTAKGLPPADLQAILDEIEQLCGKLGVRIEPDEDARRVYVYGVKIEAPEPVAVR
jgi:hypothetical protein